MFVFLEFHSFFLLEFLRYVCEKKHSFFFTIGTFFADAEHERKLSNALLTFHFFVFENDVGMMSHTFLNAFYIRTKYIAA